MASRSFKKAGAFEEKGQTLIEYGLTLAIIAVVTIGVLVFLGVTLGDSYEMIAFSIPDINWFEKSLSVNHITDVEGYIQWFLVDN